jgi:predicted component of type VI protein secretion system
VAKLLFKSGPYTGKSVTLPMGKSLTMGRNRDLELPLPDLKLSRRHCQIVFNGERCILKDLGSTNGTMINGTRLAGEVELNDFDRIVLGDTEIEFHYAEKVPLPVTFDPNEADPFGLDEDQQPQDVPLQQPANIIPGGQAAVVVPLQAVVVEEIREFEAVAVLDPLAEALHEMCQPLPPEPPPAAAAPSNRPMVVFCEGCEGSVPMLDLDLGVAREIEGKTYCKDCLAKGVNVGAAAAAPAAAAPAAMFDGKTQAVPKPAPRREKTVDDILAALDDEAVVVDTTLKRGSTILNEDEAARRLNQMEKVQQQVAARPVHKPAAPPQPAAKDVKEELGEEFEEIG